MGIGLILIAVGAILTWAVETSVSGLDVNAVGVILDDRRPGRARALAGLLVDLLGPEYFRRTVVSGPDRRRRHVVVEDAPADEVIEERY